MVRFCELPSRTASADKFLVPVITVVQWAGQQGETVTKTVDDETKSEVVSTNPDTQVEKCEACGRELAVDETFTEHLVCVHLTTEGLCDICGGDSEDFVEHFKMHLKSCHFQALPLPPMVSIKAELVDKADLDDNENCINDMNEGISVK